MEMRKLSYVEIVLSRGAKSEPLACIYLVFSFAGAEAMFADLGHFSVRSIQVCDFLNSFLEDCEDNREYTH